MTAQKIKEISIKTKAICEGQFACMEWLNKPQNFKQVSHISSYLKEISEKYDFKLSVFDRKKSEKLGLGAFLAVNQGSSQEAAFTVIEYNCGKKSAKTVGFSSRIYFCIPGLSYWKIPIVRPSLNN